MHEIIGKIWDNLFMYLRALLTFPSSPLLELHWVKSGRGAASAVHWICFDDEDPSKWDVNTGKLKILGMDLYYW